MNYAYKMNYAVNPTNYQQSVNNTLQDILSKDDSSPNAEVILRISESGDAIIARSDLLVRPTPTRKDYDSSSTEEPKEDHFSNDNSGDNPSKAHQEACVELLRSVMDIDVSLPMGYAIFENPLANTETDKVEMDCVLTLQDLFHYLASVNAVPYYEEETGRWKGIEKPVSVEGTESTQSTMVFTITYRYLRMERENAIAYLKALLKYKGGEDVPKPTVLSTTDQMKAKIYVVPLPPCVISIVKDSPLYTAPISKQRLLYLFDCIQMWMRSLTMKWIEMRFNTQPINLPEKLMCFRYKIEKMVQGWKGLPTPKVDPREMTIGITASSTPQWKLFKDTSTPEASLKDKMHAVVSFLYDYGIDMGIESYVGPMEDYIETPEGTQRNFVPPVREVLAPIIITTEMPRQYGDRGRGRGRGRGSFRGRGRSDNDTGDLTMPLPKSRGRGGNSERGSSRGRGTRNDNATQNTGRGAAVGSRAMPIRYSRGGRGRARQ